MELTPTHAVQAWSVRLTLARYSRAILAGACTISALVVLLATWQGVGLSPDSLQYLSAAESVAAGHGLETIAWEGSRVPLTHYPPGYPVLLSALAQTGLSPQSAARLSNVVLLTLTLIMIGAITARLTPKPWWTAAVTVFACAIAHDFVVVHSMAWSEPLYLTLTTAGMLALATALDRRSLEFLGIAAAFAAIAALTRYVALANVGLVSLAVLLWWPSSLWKRLGGALTVAVLMIAPLLITLLIGGDATDGVVANRHVAWHPIDLTDARLAASVVVKWVTPLNDASYLTALWLGALVLLVALAFAARARQAPPIELSADGRRVVRILSLYAVLYAAVAVLAMTLVDAQTLFEPRLLVPLEVVLFILGISWLARQERRGVIVRRALIGAVTLVLLANALRWWPWVREAQTYGLALRRPETDAAVLVDAARRMPPSARIYSNDPYYLRVHAQRAVAGVPRTHDPNSLLPNPRHAAQVQEICESAKVRPTFLVLSDTPVSGDSTAQAPAAAHSGEGERLTGGMVFRVRPGCTS